MPFRRSLPAAFSRDMKEAAEPLVLPRSSRRQETARVKDGMAQAQAETTIKRDPPFVALNAGRRTAVRIAQQTQ